MVILYKDPQGKKIMQEANVHLSDETAVTFAANKDGESDTIAKNIVRIILLLVTT